MTFRLTSSSSKCWLGPVDLAIEQLAPHPLGYWLYGVAGHAAEQPGALTVTSEQNWHEEDKTLAMKVVIIFSRPKLSITWINIILLLWVILNSILSLIPIYTCSNHQWFATESHITSKIWQRGVRWGMSGFWQRHWASDRHSEPGDREIILLCSDVLVIMFPLRFYSDKNSSIIRSYICMYLWVVSLSIHIITCEMFSLTEVMKLIENLL